MTTDDVEIGRLVGQALTRSLQDGFERLERRLSVPVQNASPQPMVVSTGGNGPPVINMDTRALGQAIGEAVAAALAPVLNELAEGREMMRQTVEGIVGLELRPTINVPEAAVHVDLGQRGNETFLIEHDFENKTSTVRRK